MHFMIDSLKFSYTVLILDNNVLTDKNTKMFWVNYEHDSQRMEQNSLALDCN